MKSIGKWIKAAMFAAGLSLGASAQAAPSNVFVFGDSLMDTGNLFLAAGIPPSPPYFGGRFSNGPLFGEIMAGNLGFALTPSILGGNNFSWAGAQTGTGLSSGFIPNVQTQINQFLGAFGGLANPNALYIIDGGGNDVLPASAAANVPAAIAAIVGNIKTEVETLAAAGAKNFVIINVARVGDTPRVQALGAGAVGGANFISNQINQGLLSALMDIHSNNKNLDLDLLDLFALGTAVNANPAAFGFTNGADPCFNGVTVCANPDEYLYWDTFHPTAAVGRIIAATSTLQIPEPATLMLLSIALAGMALRARRV